MRLEGWHIVIIIVIAILLFGAPKLPGLARSVGQSLRIFKSEVRQMKDENSSGTADGEPVEGRVVNNPAAAPTRNQGPETGPTPPSGTHPGTGNPPTNP